MNKFPWKITIKARIDSLDIKENFVLEHLADAELCITKFETFMGRLEEHSLHIKKTWDKIVYTGAPKYWTDDRESNYSDIQAYVRKRSSEKKEERAKLYEKYPVFDCTIYILEKDVDAVKKLLQLLWASLEEYEAKIRNLHTEETWFLINSDGVFIFESKKEHEERIWKYLHG